MKDAHQQDLRQLSLHGPLAVLLLRVCCPEALKPLLSEVVHVGSRSDGPGGSSGRL